MSQKHDQAILKNLMERAERSVRGTMLQFGGVPKALLFENGDGCGTMVSDQAEMKPFDDHFEQLGRLLCMAYNPSATVLVTELWLAPEEMNQPVEFSHGQERKPGKEEVVAIVGETRKSLFQKILPVNRDEKLNFKSFGESKVFSAQRVHEGMARYICPIEPDEKTQNRAREKYNFVTQQEKRLEKKSGRERKV